MREVVTASPPFADILGESAEVRRMCSLIDAAAQTDSTVLVTGESGTGKELVARALHERGPRKAGPFVAMNCAAMTDTLLESELFGHARGAFTDAKDARVGLFVKAGAGTLFLDEIGDMPAGMQAKLLARPRGAGGAAGGQRQRGSLSRPHRRPPPIAISRAKSRTGVSAKISTSASTSSASRFRRLRARGGDIVILAQSFARKLGQATRQEGDRHLRAGGRAVARLPVAGQRARAAKRHRARRGADALRGDRRRGLARDRARLQTNAACCRPGEDTSELLPMHEVEKRYILRVLEAVGGNKTSAAQILGFDRRTMYRKLERFEKG